MVIFFSFLAGEGAFQWAMEHGLSTCHDEELITGESWPCLFSIALNAASRITNNYYYITNYLILQWLTENWIGGGFLRRYITFV